jgi:broad specificity phosphatase PhoE
MDQVIGRAFDGAVRDEERFIGGETLLAVLHEGVNRLLLSWALTGGRAAMVGLEQDPGCVNVVDFDVVDGTIVRSLVRTVNVTPADPSKRTRAATGMEELCATYRLRRESFTN